MKKILLSIIPLLFVMESANACHGSSCTGKKAGSCPVSFYRTKNIYYTYTEPYTGATKKDKIGRLTFYFSESCKANWAKVTVTDKSFLNEDYWAVIEKLDGSGNQNSTMNNGVLRKNGISMTPMIDGSSKVKAKGCIDGSSRDFCVTLSY